MAFGFVEGKISETLKSWAPQLRSIFARLTSAEADIDALELAPPSHTHTESDITDLSHDAAKIQGVDVTVTSIGDNEILQYDSGSGDYINQTLAEAGISATGHSHAASDTTSGEFADGRISESSVTQHEGAIDHDQLTNFAIGEHRIINDAGTSATELWSASKIDTELGGKSDTGHSHAASDTTSGTFDDARISESSVVQHADAIIDDRMIDREETSLEFENTDVQQTLYSISIPANTVLAGTGFRVRIFAEVLNNTGVAETVQFRMEWGSTSINQDDLSFPASATRYGVVCELEVFGKSSSAQVGYGMYNYQGSATGGVGDFNQTSTGWRHNMALTGTSANTFSLKITMSDFDTNFKTKRMAAYVEKI